MEMEKKKRKIIESDNGEIRLPEAIIQHIQSFMSRGEAAQTTVLSKSWYSAWLTRPVLDLDCNDFPGGREPSPLFEEYAKKTMQRYQGSNLKIERFRLNVDDDCSWVHDLIVNAMNIGATDFQIGFPSSGCILPKEVLGSQTLLRLSASYCTVDGNSARCSSLQSLVLDYVEITDDGFKDVISCCGSIEELSVYDCSDSLFTLSWVNLPKLHKLRRLLLDHVYVCGDFFTDFASRFPCLKDLAILGCEGYSNIGIASTSLQTIHFTSSGRPTAKFDVPNIRKFTYSGSGLPSELSIKGGSSEWELDISIECDRFHKDSWFLKLKKLLTKFRPSRISLNLDLFIYGRELGGPEHEVDIEVVPKPLVLENLTIDAPSSLCCALLLRLFGISRPKFITSMFYSRSNVDAYFPILYNRLMQKPVTPNCGIPDQDMFGKFGLKKVNMEVYEKVDAKWLPLMLEKPLDPSKTPAMYPFKSYFALDCYLLISNIISLSVGMKLFTRRTEVGKAAA